MLLDPVTFDRIAQGFSLGVHIILASIGIALPVIMLLAEYLGKRNNDKFYLVLARRLSIALVVFFAVGAASGTLVAVELFTLWPKFMALVSQVSILPFYVEVFAFFAESIFLGIYIYSWDKFSGKYTHLLPGIVVAVGAAASGLLITMINAFMNTPAGFNISTYLTTGAITGVNPLAAFNTPSTAIEVFHVLGSSFFAGSAIFLLAMSFMFLRAKSEVEKTYYKKAITLLFLITLVTSIITVYGGIKSISSLYSVQPEKYAALELNLVNQTNAPELLGGIYVNGTVQYALPVPGLQSLLLSFEGITGPVPGLNQFPQSTWPPLFIHDLFDFMVGGGFLLVIILVIVLLLVMVNKKPNLLGRKPYNLVKRLGFAGDVLTNRKVLILFILIGVLSVILLEDGWILAELGRQPWIIYNVMLVSDAANPSPSIVPIATAIIVFFAVILPVSVWFLNKIYKRRPLKEELEGP
jgi:cytochrome d ubiquinol oxidase subunit I